MQILASLFFVLVFALAAGMIGQMILDYRGRIVAALAGQGAPALLGITFYNFSIRTPRTRQGRTQRFSPVRRGPLPLAA